MRSILRVSIMCFFLLPSWLAASTMTDDMKRMGQGKVYFMSFIKVYDAYLYSNEITGEKDILSNGVSKCLRLEYTVDVDKSDFIKAANTVLERQFTKEQLAGIRTDIETLHRGYRNVQDGDAYTLCYNSADNTTTLSLNGGVLVSVDSPGFSEVYFSIWLGPDEPLDESLRDDLLAGLVHD